MTIQRLVSAAATCGLATIIAQAQVVEIPAAKEIKCSKAEVTCLAISPKGDKILVGLDHGAELYDLESGRRTHTFKFSEDESNVVYYCAFNPNGEYVVLTGYSGKREVWDVKTGEQDREIAPHNWIPDPRATKAMGLQASNSAFDRFYQQTEAGHGAVKAKAVKDGAVEFCDAEGNVMQKLVPPANKDQHHRAPCLFHEQWFITGTDDGRVLFYTVR